MLQLEISLFSHPLDAEVFLNGLENRWVTVMDAPYKQKSTGVKIGIKIERKV